MTHQPDLFRKMCGTVRTRQPKLFDTDGPPDSNLSCECGEALVPTPGGYLACPKGHGRLREAQADAGPQDASWRNGDLFTTDEGE